MSFSLWLQRLRRKTKAPNGPKGKRSIAAKLRVEWLEPRLAPATIIVNSAADDPTLILDSLRAAITSINNGADANAAITANRTGAYGSSDIIDFAIPGTGVQTIAPTSALPTINKPVVIDGTSQPGFAGTPLIELTGAGAGTFADGLDINIAGASSTANATISGLAINSFAGDGILLLSGFNTVTGNFIGTKATGTPAGNVLSGVHISGGHDNLVGGTGSGAANIIAFNGRAGVTVDDDDRGTGTAIHNGILGNSIVANSALGIDLGGTGTPVANDSRLHVGPNNFQNFPVLSSASNSAGGTTILGTLHSSPATNFIVEFFSNQAADPSGFGQGQTFLGRTTVTTDGIGNASFASTFATQVPAGQFISSTATDPTNNTSEFSQDVPVQRGGAIVVTGIAFCAKEGVPVNNAPVATFTDSGVPQPASNYTATINWGDGTPLTAGMVTGSGSTFTVLGSHSYAAEEFYTVTVTLSDPNGRSGTESLSVLVGGFVTSLYQDVLNRLPDRSGLDAWVQQLHAGTLNRQQVALGFLTSLEARGLQVDLYYGTFLHRTADPAGRQHWVQQLMSGVSDSQVLVGILTSPEFTASHPDSTSFVNALFVGILNRTGGASEVSFWQQRLDSGALTRADAILAFLSSTEAYSDAIDENYLTFLDRQPDPAGQQSWFSRIVSGQLTPTTFSAAILGSGEYLALALTCPPPPT